MFKSLKVIADVLVSLKESKTLDKLLSVVEAIKEAQEKKSIGRFYMSGDEMCISASDGSIFWAVNIKEMFDKDYYTWEYISDEQKDVVRVLIVRTYDSTYKTRCRKANLPKWAIKKDNFYIVLE